ncbi:PAS domain S-box-containing protein [Singulisphaera sp. GP187]|uniref:PAS domain S-box protein n=1 Tax=Singulisphaera sp. GP187 TaxID=1882752 RepID=UPI000926BC8B|nr:PAS domain S-box protein [Singulisphaera sp. GP187]SIO61311.1 PAS domain S-box-containing protein [Singulisphaera sp. GP187]
METVRSLHILVIEDDADTRANLRDILELDDHRVEVATSAAEAMARDNWASISAIILDRRLPDTTADELLPRLRRVAPDAAVIIVTGYLDLQGAVSALRHGATDYILKPIDPDDLRTRLGRIAKIQGTGDKLKRQAEIIRSLLENATDAIIVVDVQGRVLLSNPAVERLIGPLRVGAPPEEWGALGKAYRPDAASTDSRREPPLARALRREPVTDEEVFVRRLEPHSGRWMSVNASPICVDGVIKGAVIIYRDITERKRAEEELRRERDLAEGLIDAAPAVVVLLSPEGRIVRYNHFAEDLSGYRAEEVLGQDFFETLLPRRDRVRIREVFRKTLDEVETNGTANAIVTKSGREREIRWSNRVLKNAEGKIVGVLALGQDFTDLKEAQERALHAERLAAIGEMVAGLAHESRNALQRSQACLEMLALHVQDRPKAIGLIDRLQQAQDHLHHLYEDVRGYAAPIRLERRLCKLAEIWREAWADLKPQWAGRAVTLVESGEDPDQRCAVDPFRLGQVFHNILENALSACVDPVKIEVGCTRIEVDGVPLLRVAVRDNGPGVGPEHRERIFEPFYTTKTKGTGLGMAIARRIIEAHGGQIAAGQAAGQGAEIVITLPQGEP